MTVGLAKSSKTPYFYYLKCDCVDWQINKHCGHLLDLIRKQEDAQLFREMNNFALKLMFTKDPRIDIMVYLMKFPNYSEVILVKTLPKSPDFLEGTDPQSIGGIFHTDGITMIRSLIIDWLLSLPGNFPNSMRCASSAHTVGDSWLDDSSHLSFTKLDFSTRKMLLIDIYNLYINGICYKCIYSTEIPQAIEPFSASKGEY